LDIAQERIEANVGHTSFPPCTIQPSWKGEFEMKTVARLFALPALLLFWVAPIFAQTDYRIEIFAAAGLPMDKEFQIGLPQSSPSMKGVFD
jgi:hypothetical protein